MPKLKMKEIPSLNGRVLRQMISGRDGVETLHELYGCCTARVCRGIILQYDAQIIGASGLLTGSGLPEFDSGPGRRRKRRRSRQIARDLVNPRRGEVLLFALFATTAKNCEKEANSEQGKTY
jgi:hypothetical protein